MHDSIKLNTRCLMQKKTLRKITNDKTETHWYLSITQASTSYQPSENPAQAVLGAFSYLRLETT